MRGVGSRNLRIRRDQQPRTVVQRAQHLGVEMPIAEGVVALLDGQTSPAQAVAELMRREAKGE